MISFSHLGSPSDNDGEKFEDLLQFLTSCKYPVEKFRLSCYPLRGDTSEQFIKRTRKYLNSMMHLVKLPYLKHLEFSSRPEDIPEDDRIGSHIAQIASQLKHLRFLECSTYGCTHFLDLFDNDSRLMGGVFYSSGHILYQFSENYSYHLYFSWFSIRCQTNRIFSKLDLEFTKRSICCSWKVHPKNSLTNGIRSF
jgi:hypothetical protein